jgi:hypothetical protein
VGEHWSPIHTGQDLHINVVRDTDGVVIATWSTVVDSTGDIATSFLAAIEAETAYTLDFYADHNSDGDCDPVPTDHVWHQPFGVLTGVSEVRVDHDGSRLDSAGCGSF